MRLLLLLYAWIPSILSIESMARSTDSDDRLFRNLVSVCEDGTKPFIHYFEVTIVIQPDTLQLCPIADQIKLGLAIDYVLASENIGETGVDDDVIVAAKVCPKPITNTTSSRRQLALRTTFVFNGGGGCRGCVSDNLDARRRKLQLLYDFGTSEWFENVYAFLLEMRLKNAIQFLVVPYNFRCLGLLPIIAVEIHKVTKSELASRFECQLGSLTPVLTSMSLNTVITPERECKTCHNVNFSSTSDGIILRNGREINQEWNAIGCKINATATTSAANPLKVRIFDTSNSTCIQATSTQEFGSPNTLCPGGGLGVGNGGAPGSDGENCNSIGNVLILQDPNTSGQCPVPNKNGGKMIFQFDSPVYFVDIGLLDADETQTRLLITYEDNAVETYKFTTFGDNSVQRVIVSKNNVIKFEVLFVTGSGAITDVNYCTLCALQVAAKTNQGCIIAGNTVTNTLNLIELNDFEGDIAENSLQGWTYGTLNSNQPSNFTKFLGLYNQSNAAPHKTFSVPKNASAILFDLDFYMIDNWLVNEEIWIFVDEERIPIPISASLNPVQQMGNTSLGILWTSSPNGKRVNLGFLPYLDQKYHITIEIPASTNLYNDGNVRLLLRVGNTTTSTKDRYAGWDNIKVSAC